MSIYDTAEKTKTGTIYDSIPITYTTPQPSLASKVGTVASNVGKFFLPQQPTYAPSLYDQVTPPKPDTSLLAPTRAAIGGVISGFQNTPVIPKELSTTAPGQATMDAFSKAIQQGGDNLATNIPKIFDDHNTALQRGVAAGQATVGTINALFGALLSPLQGIGTIPVIGSVVDGVNKLFGAVGEGAGAAAVQSVNEMPLSQETKDLINPLIHDSASLVAQIYAGKVAGDAGKVTLAKLTDNSKAVLAHLTNDAALKEAVKVPVASDNAVTPVKINKIEPQPTIYDNVGPNFEGTPSKNIEISAPTESDINAQKLEQIKTEISIREDAINSMPGKKLQKYVSKTTGMLPEMTGKATMKSLTGSGKTVKTSEFGRTGDQKLSEILGSGENAATTPTMEDAQRALEAYQTERKTLNELKTYASDLQKSIKVPTTEKIPSTASIATPKEIPQIETSQLKTPVTPRAGAQKPIEGTGELKTRTLSQGIEAKAIENNLTTTFGDLPEYKTVSMADQAVRAAEYLKAKPQEALDVAMGRKAPPKNVLPESVLVAVEHKAIMEGDVQTLRDLATNSHLSYEATTMGQRIRTLAERDPSSPVGAIKAVQDARELALKEKGINMAKEVDSVSKEVRTYVKKAVSSRPAWEDFIKSIQCGY